ncbi:uncharacterized protein V2V93DRAFT_317951, partial [Kockiozyma suomiensis]|uniref:uncharacterized protein n=1 Tax=Kockiozyma suomiensis TaxID=1337062 RepID=UPI0033438F87
ISTHSSSSSFSSGSFSPFSFSRQRFSSSLSYSSPSNLISRLHRNPTNPIVVIIEDKKEAYKPGDGVSGSVIITPKHDTPFTTLIVTLEGTARTWNDRGGIGNRISVRNTFLKMSCPIDEEDYPSPRILRANTTYSFYFSFILPEHLLETECEYIDCHRKLPSSLGKGSTFTHDDCAPDMARITYQVHAKVLHLKADNRRTMPFQHSSNITVVAAYEPNISTLPHHHFQDQEVSYSESGGFTRFYRTSKTLERSLLRRAPPGKVTLEASILNPFIYLQQNSAAPLLLAVSYSPHSTKSEPPRVESVSVKLRVYTYSSTISMTYLPVPNSQATDPRLGVYCESYVINSTVFPTSFASQWTQESAGHYTFNKTLTLQSPQNRTLVPNFWSCLVGRQYEASVTVVLSGVGSLSLKIPVEVTTPEIA